MTKTLTPDQVAMNDALERESVTELRDIEERLYRLSERWNEAHDAGRSNLINQWGYDAMRLCVAREIVDGATPDDDEEWQKERDARRQNERFLKAMESARAVDARLTPTDEGTASGSATDASSLSDLISPSGRS